MSALEDLTGQRFGLLIAIKHVGRDRWGKTIWECQCDCGNITRVQKSDLKSKRQQRTVSCGCRRKRARARSKHRFWNHYRGYIRGAEQRGFEFSLTPEGFESLIYLPCHYCGAEPSNKMKRFVGEDTSPTYNGLDRIDSDKGYSVENCVPCCKICNRAKFQMSYEKFVSWIHQAHDHLKGS